jgi:probable rRNA maturation factor
MGRRPRVTQEEGVSDDGRPSLGVRPRTGGDDDPEVFCADEQTEISVDLERWQRLAENVLASEGVRGGTELSLLFVGRDDIAVLNSEHLGHEGPTDVLAFPIDASVVLSSDHGPSRGPDRAPSDPGDLPMLLGDVVICPGVAVDQAPEHAGTVDDELALLVVHGILHVLGRDHDTTEATADMRRRELELLEAHHWGGPAPAGFRQDQA